MADDPDLREFYDSLLSYQSKALENSAAYNQVIILAGYAAFFAVWSTVADQIPQWVMLLSGALMVISVIVYVGWTVVGMVVLQSYNARMVAELSKGYEGFYSRLAAVEEQGLRLRGRLLKRWLAVVIVAGSTALVAAVLLASASLLEVAADNGPVLDNAMSRAVA